MIAYLLFQEELTEILTGPFLALNQSLVFTGLPEGFLFQLKIALLGGCVLASPVIIYQLMRFILPALYSHEKKIFYIMSFFGVVLFVGGICFGYFLVLQPVMGTLLKLAGTDLTPMITASSYMSFVLGFLIPFGLVFEIPMVIYFLTSVGLITPDKLAKVRKYVLLVVLVIAALLTPPDIISQLCLAAPMLLLYEAGILISKVVYKRKLKKEAKQAEKEKAEREAEEKLAAQVVVDAVLAESAVTTLADSIETTESLADKLAKNAEDTVASALNSKKIIDLKSSITLGDRFRFQRELFGGNGEKMNKAISDFNSFETMTEAQAYISKNFDWQLDNDAVSDFIQLLQRRYL